MRYVLFTVFILIDFALHSQDDRVLKNLSLRNDTIKVVINKLYTSKTDQEKKAINKELIQLFYRTLTSEGSFTHEFDCLNAVGILTSPDNKFKIYNWNLPYEDGSHEYFGFIHAKQIAVRKVSMFKKYFTESYKVYPLNDVSANVSNAENYIGDNTKWFGMLYYHIIPRKMNKDKMCYTLLGWDGNDKFSSKKIIDVLTFDSKGKPVFGGSVFNTPKGVKKRVVFEYSSSCVMSLKYNTQKDSIVFDHLIPTEPQLEGQFQYYCTDFTYDGYGYSNGKWNFGEHLKLTNPKKLADKLYSDPKNSNESVKSNKINEFKAIPKKE